MKSYLSIDLDYWLNYNDGVNCLNFFKKVFALNIPIFVTVFHDQLIHHINCHSDFDTLYNVDYHDDIISFEDDADRDSTLLYAAADYNWVNYVSWRCGSDYIWIPPPGSIMQQDGFCDRDHNVYRNPKFQKLTQWGSVRHLTGPRHIDFRSIAAIGVCLSPDFSTWQTIFKPCLYMGIADDIQKFMTDFRSTWFKPFVYIHDKSIKVNLDMPVYHQNQTWNECLSIKE